MIRLPKFSALLALALSLPIAHAQEESDGSKWIVYKGPDDPGQNKRIVLISGDEEYRSEEALSQLGEILSERHGFDSTVLYAQDPARPGYVHPNKSFIPGLEALEEADLMIISTRFRALPDEQMEHIKAYLMAGKPVLGIRTATHAFQFPEDSKWAHWSWDYDGPKEEWKGGFGAVVLGTTWVEHHGWHGHESTRGIPQLGHPIANGIYKGDIWGPSDVYGLRLPIPEDWEPVAYGEVLAGMSPQDPPVGPGPYEEVPFYAHDDPDFHKNEPMMPIAWTKTYQLPGGEEGKAFTSTIGASVDLVAQGTRRLLVNATYWLLDMPVPTPGADVRLVGDYAPTMFGMKLDETWQDLSIKIEGFAN